MSAKATAAPPDAPLTVEHQRELSLASARTKKIRRAASVASFNGWITGIIAACSAPLIFFDWTNLVVTAVLSVVAYNEFQGRRQLLQFDPSGAARLGWNQIGFLAVIVLYCLWMIFVGLTSPSALAGEIARQAELQSVLGSAAEFNSLYKLVVIAFYGTVIALSAVFQGLTALYYFTRRKHVEAYLRETPQWVVDVQRISTR